MTDNKTEMVFKMQTSANPTANDFSSKIANDEKLVENLRRLVEEYLEIV
jgi:hypothetical protein